MLSWEKNNIKDITELWFVYLQYVCICMMTELNLHLQGSCVSLAVLSLLNLLPLPHPVHLDIDVDLDLDHASQGVTTPYKLRNEDSRMDTADAPDLSLGF